MSTEATAVVDYGDGTSQETFANVTSPFSFSHAYSNGTPAGNYTPRVTIWNMVDNQTFDLTYNGVIGKVSFFFF